MRVNGTSSNINEVIRAVLNFLLFSFFYEKILHAQKTQKDHKAQKAQKAQKAPKSTKSTKSTKTQPSKSTKRK